MSNEKQLQALLMNFAVTSIANGSVLAGIVNDAALLHGWVVALDRKMRRTPIGYQASDMWLREQLRRLATDAVDDRTRAIAAEVEAALRLSWLGPLERVPEASTSTCDFRLSDVNVEVYCPQEHVDEREVGRQLIADGLAAQKGERVKVAVAIVHSSTGSGRYVDETGNVRKRLGNKALEYPANKLIDRILHTKRDGAQLREGEPNVLWLDLKNGLRMSAVDCLPLRSMIAKEMCFVGSTGIWHAFYGAIGSPFLGERSVIDFPARRRIYEQKRTGWFREMEKASAVVLSVRDGVMLFENPWAERPLDISARAMLLGLSDLRPEFSWFDARPTTLELRVAAELERIASLCGINAYGPG